MYNLKQLLETLKALEEQGTIVTICVEQSNGRKQIKNKNGLVVACGKIMNFYFKSTGKIKVLPSADNDILSCYVCCDYLAAPIFSFGNDPIYQCGISSIKVGDQTIYSNPYIISCQDLYALASLENFDEESATYLYSKTKQNSTCQYASIQDI